MSPCAPSKTHTSKQLEEAGFVHINQDVLGNRRACESACAKALRGGFSVAVDRCNPNEEQRSHWVRIAQQTANKSGGRVFLAALQLLLPLELCKRRARERTGHPTLAPQDAAAVIDGFASSFVEVEQAEGFDHILTARSVEEVEQALQQVLQLAAAAPTAGAKHTGRHTVTQTGLGSYGAHGVMAAQQQQWSEGGWPQHQQQQWSQGGWPQQQQQQQQQHYSQQQSWSQPVQGQGGWYGNGQPHGDAWAGQQPGMMQAHDAQAQQHHYQQLLHQQDMYQQQLHQQQLHQQQLHQQQLQQQAFYYQQQQMQYGAGVNGHAYGAQAWPHAQQQHPQQGNAWQQQQQHPYQGQGGGSEYGAGQAGWGTKRGWEGGEEEHQRAGGRRGPGEGGQRGSRWEAGGGERPGPVAGGLGGERMPGRQGSLPPMPSGALLAAAAANGPAGGSPAGGGGPRVASEGPDGSAAARDGPARGMEHPGGAEGAAHGHRQPRPPPRTGGRGGRGGGDKAWVLELRARYADPRSRTPYDVAPPAKPSAAAPPPQQQQPAAECRRADEQAPKEASSGDDGAVAGAAAPPNEQAAPAEGAAPDAACTKAAAPAEGAAPDAACTMAAAPAEGAAPDAACTKAAASAEGAAPDAASTEAAALEQRAPEEGAHPAIDPRVILLFDLNGTLTSHTSVRHASGITKLRPGTKELLKLKEHFRLGVYTSSTVRTVHGAVQQLEAEAGEPLFEPGLVLYRDHTTPAPKHHVDAGGDPWDTLKPLGRYFSRMGRVVLVDDDAYKSIEGEAANMLLVPCWRHEDPACPVLPLMVQLLLEHVAPADKDADVRELTPMLSARLKELAEAAVGAATPAPASDASEGADTADEAAGAGAAQEAGGEEKQEGASAAGGAAAAGAAGDPDEIALDDE